MPIAPYNSELMRHSLIYTQEGRRVIYSSSLTAITTVAIGVLYSSLFWAHESHKIFYGMACVILFAVDVALLIAVVICWLNFKEMLKPRQDFPMVNRV